MRAPRLRNRGRDGYVSLLAMSFALGLALLGGGLSVGLQTYLRAAAREAGEALDRISLESAASEALGRIAAGEEHPVTPSTRPSLRLNGREVSVELSLPEGKRDLMDDPDDELEQALEPFGRAGRDLPPVSARTSLADFWRRCDFPRPRKTACGGS